MNGPIPYVVGRRLVVYMTAGSFLLSGGFYVTTNYDKPFKTLATGK
nr:MAG TPA: hypothetical protein [Caudoviricetes sp.]